MASKPSLEREQPNAKEAEVSVLGACLIDPSVVPTVLERLSPEHFYDPRHRRLLEAFGRMFAEGVELDPPGLVEHLKHRGELEAAGGMSYVAELLDVVPTAANVTYHAEIVRDRATLRRLIAAGTAITSLAWESDGVPARTKLDRAAEIVFQLATEGEDGGFTWLKRALWPAFEQIETLQKAEGGITGTATGFPDLDLMTGGYQPGDLVILAARPSMGKTALAIGSALNVALEGQAGVGMFSLEMSKEQIVQRMLCHEAVVDLGRLLRGKLADDDYVRLAQAAAHLENAPIWIDDSGSLSITQLRARARRLKAQNLALRLIVVDYVQLMHGGEGHENRNQEVGAISRGLKTLAKDLDVTVLALSQLSRKVEERQNKRPQLADLRDSGALEQDADWVCFLYRAEHYMTPKDAREKNVEGKAELIVAKQRNGPTGPVELYFRKECARFESFSRIEHP